MWRSLLGTLLLLAAAWHYGAAQASAQLNTAAAGISIDAQGTLSMSVQRDASGQLMKKKLAEAKAALDPKLAKNSALRKVSLNRLEAVLAERGGKATDEMLNLAGLTKLQYVFYYPETKDIVIAGPAEGFVPDLTGRMVGIESGRAVLQLEDLVVALRAFPPAGQGARVIGCSIDPTKEGLARMQQFLSSLPRTNPGAVGKIVSGLKESLGHHTVSVLGVSNKTHFAQVLVEADYRMKLIGIGLEKPEVKIASYVSVVSPGEVSRNALQRWYFVPNYECVRVSDDNLAAELVGEGVKLIGESELVARSGQRDGSGKQERASEVFTTSFTKMYPELSRRTTVYGQLRNLIDMSIAAAYIQKSDWYNLSGWKMELLGSEPKFAVEKYNAPTTVESTVNVLSKGSTLMTPIGGGVQIQPLLSLNSDKLLKDENGYVKEARAKIDLKALPAGQWWWD